MNKNPRKTEYDVNVVIDETVSVPQITIRTNERNKEIEEIIEAISNISEKDSPYLPAYKDDKIVMVEPANIVRIRRVGRQVVLETVDSSYVLKKTLKQLEQELDGNRFLRISQSEFINAFMVKSLDVSITGTIIIEFTNGAKSDVSRRFVKAVKQFFENK